MRHITGENMLRRAVSVTMLTLLLIGVFCLALNIQPVKSEPLTIIVPDDYPTIQEAINNANEGDTIFVRSGKYYENVVVNKTVSLIGENKSTTIIDGKGMAYVINVTANKVNISEFTIRNANTGLYLWHSGGHNISCNIIANNLWCGIHLRTSTGNIIENNVVTNNRATAWWGGSGIHLEGFSSANRIINNVISNNTWGLVLSASDLNILRGNKLINNTYGLTIEHWFDNDIDTSNTINGKPIYYLSNQKDLVIDPATFPHVGYLGIIKSENITVKNLNLTNNGQGILFAYTNKSIIQNVNLQHNRIGILLFHSSENIIEMNTISENQIEGILIDHSNRNLIRCNSIVSNYYGIGTVSGNKNNHIYHNNFISNTKQVGYRSFAVRDGKPVYAEDVWDNGYPSGGNYWSDYNGTDLYSGPYQNETGSDGIGDTPYVIDENNVDRYPLMEPWTQIVVDVIPPIIGIPQQNPSPDNVMEYQEVWVSVNVTDAESGVKNVTLRYSVDGGVTWYAIVMNYDVVTGLYQAVIPGYPACTTVAYMIVAYDNAENMAIQDNNGYYFTYHVRQYPSLISSTIDLNPKSLNLRSRDKWITAYIELPEGYNISDVDVSSVMLNETVSVDLEAPIEIGDYDNDTILDLMICFNWTEVANYILSKDIVFGNVSLEISGRLFNGTVFTGTDAVLVSSLVGDINVDGKVDMKDISIAARAFGSYPSHPRWNPITDINVDNKIDLKDICLIARNFGKQT